MLFATRRCGARITSVIAGATHPPQGLLSQAPRGPPGCVACARIGNLWRGLESCRTARSNKAVPWAQ
eukprot:scaffold71244_cov65-Phaeocystis_antarctica.AAC.6